MGGSCVYSVEWDRFARDTYSANFGAPPEGVDIRDVSELPGHHVLAAGFPCQPFSLAGVSKRPAWAARTVRRPFLTAPSSLNSNG